VSFRSEIEFADLPAELAGLIRGRQFITAYPSDSPGKIIVWVVDASRDRQDEFEFDLAQNRFLSRAEREQAFPSPSRLHLDGVGATVEIGYRLTDEGDVLCQTYDVYRDGDAVSPLRCEQMVYVPVLDPVEQVVTRALEKVDFPAIYAAWAVSEKIRYWVAALFRLRRHTGENGDAPDQAFDAALISDMRRLDGNIDAILADIVKGLALMESEDPADMIARFNARTGAMLS